MSAAMLTSVAWSNYVIEGQRLSDIEHQIRGTISNKAVTLVGSQALALKGLVADNAFGDVRQLVAGAVRDDSDVVYGLFVSADGKPWAYVSPNHRDDETAELDLQRISSELQLDEAVLEQPRPAQRSVLLFGEELQEYRAPVRGEEDELLGTIVYGFSNKRTLTAVAAAGERSRHALLRAFLTIGVTGLLSFLIAIAWVLRAAAKISKPVAELTSAANEIAAGKRGVRVAIASQDEVQVLAGAFNHMLEANEDAMRKLEATTERALAADRLKSEFLANMSHEIRTPMNGVLGMIKLIQGMPLDGKLKRYVETIDSSANALLTIINDILDFSKMEAGRYTIQSLWFEPRTVIQEVAELLASRAHDKGIELIYRVEAAIPNVLLGDPDRFRQILNNLVGNAVKFTDRGEVFIDVSLASIASDSVVVDVAVHDTGIGIDEKDLPKLYEAFSQVDGSMVRRHGGTGLGLAICKRLVEMMGGKIEVRSELGKGSTFKFSVEFGVDAGVKLRSAKPPPAERGRVLIVDSNRRWREVIEEHVNAWGMDCESCTTGAEALDRLQRQRNRGKAFDAVIASSDLEDTPGVALVRAIRGMPELASMPVILLTAQRSDNALGEEVLPRVVELHKPLRFSELYNCLNGTLSGHMTSADTTAVKPRPLNTSHKPVLVVDDNDINRFVAVGELEQRGFRTEEAVNGAQAVEKFSQRDYLCVLMDCQMPTMDGYEATRSIREIETREGRRRTPIIALTAHALVGERERVLKAGMDDFLSKPFRPSSLEKLLQFYVNETASAEEPPTIHLDPSVKRSEKLIRLFLEKVPAQLDDLEAAIARSSSTDVRAVAHKLKGSCLAIAAERMLESAELVRRHGANEQFPAARAALLELRLHFAVAAELLKAELGKPAAAGGMVQA